MKLALHVIAGAGFGVPFTWNSTSSDEIWPSHHQSFRSAIDNTLHHLLPLMFLPKWALGLPVPYLRVAKESYEEFGGYMRELLEREKKREKKPEKGETGRMERGEGTNLLGALARHARECEELGEVGLSDDEIIGNTFIFLIAGHETRYEKKSFSPFCISQLFPPLPLFRSMTLLPQSLPSSYSFHNSRKKILTLLLYILT